MRVSTTVDEALSSAARRLRSEATDAALLDEALTALLTDEERRFSPRCDSGRLTSAGSRRPILAASR